jgi:hypothetical protein
MMANQLMGEFYADYMSWSLARIHFPKDQSPAPTLKKPWMNSNWLIWAETHEPRIKADVEREVARTYNKP